MANLKLDGVSYDNIHNVTVPRADDSGDQWFVFGDILQYVGTFDIVEATDADGGNKCSVAKGALTALKNAVDTTKFKTTVQAVMIPADQALTREAEWIAAFKQLDIAFSEDTNRGGYYGIGFNSYAKTINLGTGAYPDSSVVTVNYDKTADMAYLKDINGRLTATKMHVFYLDIPFMKQQSS